MARSAERHHQDLADDLRVWRTAVHRSCCRLQHRLLRTVMHGGVACCQRLDAQLPPTRDVHVIKGRAWTMSVLCKAVVFLLLALPAVAQSRALEGISIKP